MKYLKLFENEVVNKNFNPTMRLVEATYEGKKIKAIAIGFASGPYYMEKYFLIDETKFEYGDFTEIKDINPSSLLS